jgi:HAD superfamily phosphatase (TIGR01668 family)
MDIKYWLKYILLWGRYRGKIVTQQAEDLFAFDFAVLKTNGVKLLIFDVDDTLTAHLGDFGKEVSDLCLRLKKQGFSVAAFSNSRSKRTKELGDFFNNLGVYNVSRSDKPNPAGYREIIDHFNISGTSAAMFGDKIGTDLFGAYLAGIRERILVTPYSHKHGGKKAPLVFKIVRFLEKLLHG